MATIDIRKLPNVYENKVKQLFSTTYRNYLYDISFEKYANEEEVYETITSTTIWKQIYEDGKLKEYLPYIVKSVGSIETELRDMTFEFFGRENKTAGRLNFKSPIMVEIYDVFLQDMEGEPWYVSDFFRWWIQRWSESNLHSRRRYQDEQAVNFNLNIFPGGFYPVASMQMDSVAKRKVYFETFREFADRYAYFPKSTDQLLFINSLHGIGGGITVHGLINIIVMSVVTGFQIGNNITKMLDTQFLQEKRGRLTKDDFTPNKTKFEESFVKDFPQFYRNVTEINIPDLETALLDTRMKFLNTNLIEKYQALTKLDVFKGVKEEVAGIVERDQFVDNAQLQSAYKLLNYVFNQGENVTNITPQGIIDAVGLKKEILSQSDLDNLTSTLNDIVSGFEIQQQLISREDLDVLKNFISRLKFSTVESFTSPENFTINNNLLKSSIQIITKIKERFVEDGPGSPLETFLKQANTVANYSLAKTSTHGGAMGWDDGWSIAFEVARNITGILSLIPYAIHVIHNAKTLWNFVGAYNGWDDFINTLPGAEMLGAERMIMDDPNTVQIFVDWYVRKTLSVKTEEAFTENIKAHESFEFPSRPAPQNIGIWPIRSYTLTRAYPTSISLPALGFDKVGEQSIPVIVVNFNFFDVEKGEQ